MVDFTNRVNSSIGEVVSELIDDALVKYTREQYEKTRGSGEGGVAYKRIGSAYAGTPCIRALAYRYHKHSKEDRESSVNKGELQRHAEAGHWTERSTVHWMFLAGFIIETYQRGADGSAILDQHGKPKQIGWMAARDANGQARMAGEVDGVLIGVPAPLVPLIKTPCLWESKKATDKKWKKFSKEKIKGADPVYYGQVQLNMAYMGMEQTLFSMLNLDTMKYYFELVSFDQNHAQMISDRALDVIQSKHPCEFARHCRSEDDFNGKFCDYRDRCWHPEQHPDPVEKSTQPEMPRVRNPAFTT